MEFSRPGLERLEARLKAHVERGAAPGLTALVARGGESHTFAVGRMALEAPAPVTHDAIFRIASMTKPITAAVAMMLVEDGQIRLDEPVDRLLPELANRRVLRTPASPLDDTVPAARAITVEDLLTFKLGWGIDFNPELPIQAAIADLPGFGMPNPASPLTPDAYMRRLGELPLMAQPGERWLYTAGSNILGVLIARAAGQPLETLFEERILGPLGMVDTAFYIPPEKLGRAVAGYVARNTGEQGGELALFDPPQGMFARPPALPAGDSGLVSTAQDYAGFARFMFSGKTPDGRRLLSETSLLAMRTNHLTAAQAADGATILGPARGWGYGLAVVTGPDPYGLAPGAYGWNGGFGTSWFNDPANGLVAILLTQRLFDSPDPPAAHKDFWRDAYAAHERNSLQ